MTILGSKLLTASIMYIKVNILQHSSFHIQILIQIELVVVMFLAVIRAGIDK